MLSNVLVGDCDIVPTLAARDIDVILDSHLAMQKHVSVVYQAAYPQLHRIAQVRWSLTQRSAATLVLSLVISKLDYGSCFLYGLPDHLIHNSSPSRTRLPGWCAVWRGGNTLLRCSMPSTGRPYGRASSTRYIGPSLCTMRFIGHPRQPGSQHTVAVPPCAETLAGEDVSGCIGLPG